MNPRIRAITALARVAISNNFFESPPENLRIEITIGEQSQACAAIIRYGG